MNDGSGRMDVHAFFALLREELEEIATAEKRKNMKTYSKILAHIPHSSIQDYGYGWMGSGLMFPQVKQLTDWHTEILFSSHSPNVEAMVFPHSRFYLDVERMENDPMESVGQGRIYTEYEGRKRSKLTPEDIDALNDMYREWRQRCAERITEDTLVVDCHSFTSSLAPEVSVCIGYNEDESKPSDEVIDYIIGKFKWFGYRVAVNEPCSHSIVFGGNHHSIMIALNKSLYMDEKTLEMDPKAYKVGGAINRIYDGLLNLQA